MSFTGELEHLPIVDVMQLLHSTRKSGILRVTSRKGESQLVFKDGYIVSANHLNNSVRIGKILVDLNIITPEVLTQALQAQHRDGKDRKPLIVTLIEKGMVKEEDAYKGLEQLIELTVVEILTWKKGTFTLDVLPSSISDEYRYYPERISREINVDTQGVLMDALRIFDEKMRDGELVAGDFPEDDGPTISADDLGLADLDRLERKIPVAFSGLTEINPAAAYRQKLEEIAPSLSVQEREELASFFCRFSSRKTAGSAHSVVFFSSDKLMSHGITVVCASAGIPVSVVCDEKELDPIFAQPLDGNGTPILVIDAPQQSEGRFSPAGLSSLRQRYRKRHPENCTIQLAAAGDAAFALQSYRDGVRAVLPSPSLEERRETYVADSLHFLTVIQAYLETIAFKWEDPATVRLKTAIASFPGLRDATSVARALLECVAGICGRALTLIVRDAELVADRGIELGKGAGDAMALAAGMRVPLTRPSLLCEVIETGRVHCGPTTDETVREHLFAMIGTPSRSTVLLLPLRRHGKTVALTYGDFGNTEPVPLDCSLLEILAHQAELVLENALYRKKLAKTVGQGTTVS